MLTQALHDYRRSPSDNAEPASQYYSSFSSPSCSATNRASLSLGTSCLTPGSLLSRSLPLLPRSEPLVFSQVKENQEKDKIRSKPDKNGKRPPGTAPKPLSDASQYTMNLAIPSGKAGIGQFRKRPVSDSFHLRRINMNTFTVDHVTEKLYGLKPEITLRKFCI
nr:hypothetical protein [Tanacetum cinerariifolium]